MPTLDPSFPTLVNPVEFTGWVQTRDKFINVMTTTAIPGTNPPVMLATKKTDRRTGQVLDPVVLVPCDGLQFDEIGPISTPDPTARPGNPKPLLKFVDGLHVNFRIWRLDIINFLNDYMATQPIDRSGGGVPDGPMGSKGLKLYPYVNNPQLLSRRRFWS